METVIIGLIYVIIVGMFIFDTWLSILNYRNRNAPIPEEVQDVYEESEYTKWLAYSMENFRFGMIVKSTNVILFVLMLSLGVFVWFNDVAIASFENARLQTLVFLGLYFAVSFVIGIFTSYYSTFTIEEKYGFNKATKKTFVFDKIKSLLLTIVFGGGLLYLVLVINDTAGNMFFFYTWLALVVIFFMVNILYVRLIVPLFNKLTPLEDGELKDALHKLANKVGYEVTTINVMDASRRSTKLNAFFTGFGRFKKIVLYDTLVEKMTTSEIVAVLAHEIGHNKHKHIWFNIVQMMVTLSVYIGIFVLVLKNDVFSTAFGFDSSNFGFSFILFVVLLDPISTLMSLATAYISRKHEFQADAFATINHTKEDMENALKVLGRTNYANLTPHPLYVKLTYSHPPIVDRIRAIRKVDVT